MVPLLAPSTSVAPLENVASPRRRYPCPSRKTHSKGSENVELLACTQM
jgi:hypothetical protein